MKLTEIYKLICEDKAEWLVKQGISKEIVDFAMSIDKKYVVWIAQQLSKLEKAKKEKPSRSDIEYVLDWVKATTPNLSAYDYDLAKAAAIEWHNKFEQDDSGNYKTNNVVHTFDNGWKIVKLSPEDCEIEGDKMGHCVGEYARRVKSGSSMIFSLRDAKNNPHATIEFLVDSASSGKKELILAQVQGKENKEPLEEYQKLIESWINVFKKEHADEYILLYGNPQDYDITALNNAEGPVTYYGFNIKSTQIGGDVETYKKNLYQIADMTNDFYSLERAIWYFKSLVLYAKTFGELEMLDLAREEYEDKFFVETSEYLTTEHPDRPRDTDYDDDDEYRAAMDEFEQAEMDKIEAFKFFQQVYDIMQEALKT